MVITFFIVTSLPKRVEQKNIVLAGPAAGQCYNKYMRHANDDLINEEEHKIRWLRWIVDLTEAVLMQSDLALHESLTLMSHTRRAALCLFPDKAFVYDLIYTPRFQRILNERFAIKGTYQRRN